MTDFANNSQRGTQDRIKTKLEKIIRFSIEAATTANESSQHGSSDDGANTHGLMEALQDGDREIQLRVNQGTRMREEAETVVMSLQQSLAEAQERAHEAEQRARDATVRAYDATVGAEQERHRREEAEQRARDANLRAEQAEQRATQV